MDFLCDTCVLLVAAQIGMLFVPCGLHVVWCMWLVVGVVVVNVFVLVVRHLVVALDGCCFPQV